MQLDGILLTHTHFDHVGAVAPVAKATGAEVWVPEIEKFVLDDINSFVPWAGFGPFESYDAEHTVKGGERLELAGFDIDFVFTPGHTLGHCALHLPERDVVISADALVTYDPYTDTRGPRIVARGATADSERALASLERIARTDAGTLLPGHGEPWRAGSERAAGEALRVGVI